MVEDYETHNHHPSNNNHSRQRHHSVDLTANFMKNLRFDSDTELYGEEVINDLRHEPPKRMYSPRRRSTPFISSSSQHNIHDSTAPPASQRFNEPLITFADKLKANRANRKHALSSKNQTPSDTSKSKPESKRPKKQKPKASIINMAKV